ncbi:MAG TPA: sodium:solute symporter [Flavipsychrobacter sp.]|nr:sodium:solute symporter [Flavipsychrobacter sp.]
MATIDWIVLVVTLFIIVAYGMWKSRNTKNIEGYLLADRRLPWYHVGLSVMATQASAITFLSAPGQAYTDGVRFVQFYFGLPLAMIVLCVTFIPIFQKLNVYTAYEYLEKRFDHRTRLFTAFLFLLQRGISTGITIYAPAIVLSTLLDIPVVYTSIMMSLLVIFYTVYGGTKAVSYTQLLQMIIIFSGLFLAAGLIIAMLPKEVGLIDALKVAGKMGKLNAIDTTFDLNNRYNIWSGIIGGFFLQLSYFGTDQSQVGRYLTGKSIAQSRLGLVMNGLVKIPMQFFILMIGALVFTFYQFQKAPLFFNEVEIGRLAASDKAKELGTLQHRYDALQNEKQLHVTSLVYAERKQDATAIEGAKTSLLRSQQDMDSVRADLKVLMQQNNVLAETNDGNYIFLYFVMHYLPRGVVGLLIAIIFLAAMGSTASGLNSLASTTVVDFYKRLRPRERTERKELSISRGVTVVWGVFCMVVALYAGRMGNLIEAVNILGSLFYGTILGVFLVAFYMKRVKGNAVLVAAVITELFVVLAWWMDWSAFLWLNLIGCVILMLLAWLLETLIFGRNRPAP